MKRAGIPGIFAAATALFMPGTLAAGAALLLLLAAACDRLSPAAPDELNPVSEFGSTLDASEIWQWYQSDTTSQFANDEFRNRWAEIRMDGVRKTAGGIPAGIDVVAGTRVILRTPGQIQTLEFNFRFPEDTESYRRGDSTHEVLCNIKGANALRNKIEFIHCRAAP